MVDKGDAWKGNSYVSLKIAPLTLFEGLFSLYFAGGIVFGIISHDWSMVPFHMMLSLGFGYVFYYSVRPRYA